MSNTFFSKRQRALIQRLETLCSRAEKETLPIMVEEVWGFGSFFRLKERPRDLDLGVKSSGSHPLWQKFSDLMEKALSARWANTTLYQSPSDALRDELFKGQEGEKLWPIFSTWVEGLTWDAIARGIVPIAAYNWDVITRRRLTKDLPGVKIMSFAKVGEKFSLVTDAVTLIWSRAKPDVGSNLLVALSPDSLKHKLVVELAGFDQQLSAVKFELKVRTQLYKSLLHLPPQVFPPEDDYRAWHKWLISKAKELVPAEEGERVKKLFESPSLFDEEAPSQKRDDEGATYRNMEFKDLQEVAERKRAELKEGHREIEVVKALLDGVANWKSRRLDKEPYFARYTVEDWLAQQALENSHKKLVNEDQIREVLRRRGLPEERILKRKGSLSDYLLPKSKEEAAKIRLSNAKLEAEQNLSKVARQEVKKFNDNLYVRVEVGDDLMPTCVRLSYHVLQSERNKYVETQLEWCRDKGFKVEEQPWATYAELQIPVRGRKNTSEIASHINEALSKPK